MSFGKKKGKGKTSFKKQAEAQRREAQKQKQEEATSQPEQPAEPLDAVTESPEQPLEQPKGVPEQSYETGELKETEALKDPEFKEKVYCILQELRKEEAEREPATVGAEGIDLEKVVASHLKMAVDEQMKAQVADIRSEYNRQLSAEVTDFRDKASSEIGTQQNYVEELKKQRAEIDAEIEELRISKGQYSDLFGQVQPALDDVAKLNLTIRQTVDEQKRKAEMEFNTLANAKLTEMRRLESSVKKKAIEADTKYNDQLHLLDEQRVEETIDSLIYRKIEDAQNVVKDAEKVTCGYRDEVRETVASISHRAKKSVRAGFADVQKEMASERQSLYKAVDAASVAKKELSKVTEEAKRLAKELPDKMMISYLKAEAPVREQLGKLMLDVDEMREVCEDPQRVYHALEGQHKRIENIEEKIAVKGVIGK